MLSSSSTIRMRFLPFGGANVALLVLRPRSNKGVGRSNPQLAILFWKFDASRRKNAPPHERNPSALASSQPSRDVFRTRRGLWLGRRDPALALRNHLCGRGEPTRRASPRDRRFGALAETALADVVLARAQRALGSGVHRLGLGNGGRGHLRRQAVPAHGSLGGERHHGCRRTAGAAHHPDGQLGRALHLAEPHQNVPTPRRWCVHLDCAVRAELAARQQRRARRNRAPRRRSDVDRPDQRARGSRATAASARASQRGRLGPGGVQRAHHDRARDAAGRVRVAPRLGVFGVFAGTEPAPHQQAAEAAARAQSAPRLDRGRRLGASHQAAVEQLSVARRARGAARARRRVRSPALPAGLAAHVERRFLRKSPDSIDPGRQLRLFDRRDPKSPRHAAS